MHNFTGNFILSKMFLNLKKKKKEEKGGGGGGGEKEKLFLDNLPGALGCGRWPASHTVPFHTIGYVQTTGQWQQSHTKKGPVSVTIFLRACYAQEMGYICLCSGSFCVWWLASFISDVFSLSQLCVWGSLLQVANFTSPWCPLSSSVGSPPSTLHNQTHGGLGIAPGPWRPTSFTTNTWSPICRNQNVLPDRWWSLHLVSFLWCLKNCASHGLIWKQPEKEVFFPSFWQTLLEQ